MRCHWERLGVLGPIYRLASQGLSDREIADQLKLTEVTVHSCIAWLLHFLECNNRAGLVRYAAAAPPLGCDLSAA
jgi:DNA-binding NarL/FixJ family response regulator